MRADGTFCWDIYCMDYVYGDNVMFHGTQSEDETHEYANWGHTLYTTGFAGVFFTGVAVEYLLLAIYFFKQIQ